jgi:hypothetical protein
MAVLLTPQGMLFHPSTYEDEASFERDVVSLADQIFGVASIYLNIKKHMGSDIVTIPDGYLIDTTKPDDPKLFVIENEIVEHDPFRHIGIQMLKFVTSFDEAQRAVRTFLMEGIKKEEKLLKRLEGARRQSSSPNIDHYLDRAIYADFKGLVVIDEATPDLHRVLEKINANISVLELKAFEADGGERIFQFDTLYDEFEDTGRPEITTKTNWRTPEERAARKLRLASSDTVVLPARDEGFRDVFIGENQWRAIRISAAMKDRIRYIAVYRVAPISAVTHLAKVKEIKPYKDTGKYQLVFDGPAEEIKHVKLREGKAAPRAPFYVQKQKLLTAKTIDDTLA